jgi:hypothetical protein
MGNLAPMMSGPPPTPGIQGPQQWQQGAMSLQALINQTKLQQQEQQVNQQTIQQQTIETQQKQQDFEDSQKLRTAFQQAGGDWNKTMELATASGIGPQKIMQIQAARLDQQTKLAGLDKDLLGNELAKHTQTAQDAQDVINLPVDERQDAWTQKANQHYIAGTFKPGEIPEQVPNQQGLEDIRNSSKAVIDELTAAQDLKTKQEKDPEIQAQAAASRLQTAAGMLSSARSQPELDSRTKFLQAQGYTPQELQQLPSQFSPDTIAQLKTMSMSPEDQAKLQASVPVDKIEMNSWLAAHPKGTPADFMAYKAKLVPAFNFSLQANGVPLSGAPAAAAAGKTGGDLISSVPATIRPTVTAVLEGRQSPPGSFALKTPYWQNVMNNVYALDPQWNEQRAQLRKAYTVGPQSKEINAINTAVGHVGVMNDAIDALNNGDVKVLNAIGNRLGVETGQDPVTTFNTIVHRVGPEIAKAYIGAGGSAGERGSDEKDFDPSLGPKQLRSNVGITAELLRSKISSLANQWDENKSQGMPSFQDRFIMPAAQQTIDRLSPQSANAPQQSTHKVGDTIIQNGARFNVKSVDANGKVTAATPQ